MSSEATALLVSVVLEVDGSVVDGVVLVAIEVLGVALVLLGGVLA